MKADYIPYTCPFCKEVGHYVRADIKPEDMLTGEDFKHDQKLVDMSWTLFPTFDDQVGANLVCAHCDNQLTISGHPEPSSMTSSWRERHNV